MGRYGKLFCCFFAMMAALTVVSRAADSVTVAKVVMEKAQRGTLSFSASAEGIVTALDQEYINGGENLFIREVYVVPGQKVKAGEPLFGVDTAKAEEQLAIAERELAELTLSARKLQLDVDGSLADQTAFADAERQLQRALDDDAFNRSINDGNQLQADRRAIEDARVALERAKKQLEEGKVRTGLELESAELSATAKREEVERLRAICANQGQVVSPGDGSIGRIQAEAGKKAPGDWLCTIVPEGGRMVVEAELSAKDAEYMKAGDSLSAGLPGKQTPIQGLVLQSVQSVGDQQSAGGQGDTVKVTALLPEGNNLACGAKVTLQHNFITDSYDSTIPLRALRGSAPNYYVLVPSEADSILGKVQQATRVEVTLLARDGKKAALKETLSDKVIVDSNKPVEAGDRIREVSGQ